MLKMFVRPIYKSRNRVLACSTALSNSSKMTPSSKGPMLQYQNALPRLPVAPLVASMQKYLQSLEPILKESQIENSKKAVEKFLRGEGPGLHTLLVKRATETDNWLSDLWLRYAYLENRSPLVVFSSPGLVFPNQEFSTVEDQIRYAVRLILAALHFKIKVDRREFEPEKMGKAFLDMSQYDNIFTTCRVPGTPSDDLFHYEKMGRVSRHIVVARNNRFFRVEVIDCNGEILPPGKILAQLRWLLENSSRPAIPVGLLTSQDRDAWYGSYQTLIQDLDNADSVSEIQESIFLVCLDQVDPRLNTDPLTSRALQALHGNELNSGNRWYDKTLQFQISQDGMVGMTYEHSPAEGPPVARLMDHITSFQRELPMEENEAGQPSELRFNVSAKLEMDVDRACKGLSRLIRNLDLHCFVFPDYGREFIKTYKQSPDSFIQMAIQLAYFRIHGKSAPTYESASLRKFLHGRTETIRSASALSHAFCCGMMDQSLSSREKLMRLKAAIQMHKECVNSAISGHGVDRLLLGLKTMSVDQGILLPEIFKDEGFTESARFRLSTSQVSATSEAVMCYGPAVEDGYGCCYNPGSNVICFAVSAFRNCAQTDAKQFGEALGLSLREMQHLIITQSSKI